MNGTDFIHLCLPARMSNESHLVPRPRLKPEAYIEEWLLGMLLRPWRVIYKQHEQQKYGSTMQTTESWCDVEILGYASITYVLSTGQWCANWLCQVLDRYTLLTREI